MENLIPFVLVVLTAIVLIPSAAGHRPYFHVRNEEKDAESTSGRNPNLNSNPIYDFAMNLYLSTSKLKSEDENVLLSPFSIRGIMALIYMASRGKTSEEIRAAFMFPESHDDLVRGLAKQISSLKTLRYSEFNLGNGIFLRDGLSLNNTYSQIIQSQLNSILQNSNFHEPKKATAQINAWVSRVTKNKIQNFLNPGSVSPFSSVVMANTLSFSGDWTEPFEKSPTTSNFLLDSGRQTTIQMMEIVKTFSYNYIPELHATGISIPFKDNRFEFIILKPNEKLGKLEALLRTYPLNHLSRQIKKQTRYVFLKLPKFRLNLHYDMLSVMKKLGIRTLFDSSSADLSGLTKNGEKHFVSQIAHETTLDVKETGAEASAATSVSINPISAPSIFTVDKPFLFLLNDRLTGPVLIGRFARPA